ncbi:hypothetical protein ACFQZC_07335 [Streptacidiphilus monticola]
MAQRLYAEGVGGMMAGMDSEVGAATVPEQRSDEPADPPPLTGAALRLELLVHGVGGTTPQDMLQDPHLAQLTGDAVAGTYRRWEDRNAEATPERYRGDAVQEAYSWANLTSGAATRALWLLLLPFMLANLVHWMRPASTRSARGYEALVRLLAVSLTALLVGAAVEAAMDLTAWQCAATPPARHSTPGSSSSLGRTAVGWRPRAAGWPSRRWPRSPWWRCCGGCPGSPGAPTSRRRPAPRPPRAASPWSSRGSGTACGWCAGCAGCTSASAC